MISKRLRRLHDRFVRAVHTRQIAQALISAAHDQSSSQSGFESDQQIEAVYCNLLAAQTLPGQDALSTRCPGLIAARCACDRRPLPLCKRIAVSNEFERGSHGVPTTEQPGEVCGCLPQRVESLRGEQLSVIRVRPAMLTMVWTQKGHLTGRK
jgi:hypothetical protein